LGLSIVKGIVEQHGGDIRIANRSPSGTQVSIRLPLIRKEDALA
jgi:signal transduction histidine kinase